MQAATAPGTATGAGLVLPSARERRAVRGRPVVDAVESEDQATVRRFEDSLPDLTPAAAPPPQPASKPAAPAPAGLAGDWDGTGDESASAAFAQSLGAGGPLGGLFSDFFKTDASGRAVLSAALARLAPWRSACEAALAEAGLPTDLLVAALASTGFNLEARGPRGEAGPWLLDADLARAQGLQVGIWLDERRDPVRSTVAAGKLLSALLDRFGSWPIALAALHAGPEVVAGALAQAATGAASERTLCDRAGACDVATLAGPGAPLPRATRLHLAKLAALAQLAPRAVPPGRRASRGVGSAGAAPRTPTPPTFMFVEVPGALTLETVARVTGVELASLRALNPALLGERVAPFVAGVSLRVPAGTAEFGRADFEAARAPADRVAIVALRLGESPLALADKRGLPAREVARLNGVRDLDELRGPTAVLLPEAGLGPPASPGPEAGPREMPDELPLVAVPARAFDVPGRERGFYFVSDGDTLEEIARAAQVTAAEIVAWNNLDPGARLQPKMVLQLYVSPALDRGRIALLTGAQVRAVTVGSEEFHALEVAQRGKTRLLYSARAGDTLPKIARRYGLGAPDLARINRMSWNSELTDGQRIIVYAPSGGLRVGGPAAGRSQPPKHRDAVVSAVRAKVAGKPAARPVPPARPAARR